jgi:GT2 family glycosyltransferase
VTVSIVSHRHGPLMADLLRDLARCHEIARVIVTYNVEEPGVQIPPALQSKTMTVSNNRPAGFAANHNAAFRRCETDYFCVMNPDIRLPQDPFGPLLATMSSAGTALAAPAVLGPSGHVECSARRFPTPWSLFLKLGSRYDGGIPFTLGGPPLQPDWVAGMFLLIRAKAFASIGGFDEGFHLYYEDVDLCARLRRAGHELIFCPAVTIVHDARRSSHRQLRFLVWHLQSMMRYFSRHMGRLPARRSLS